MLTNGRHKEVYRKYVNEKGQIDFMDYNDIPSADVAFFELLKVIFCKIEDERNITKPLEFYATSEERSNSDGQLTVKKRISKIFEQVKNKKIRERRIPIEIVAQEVSHVGGEQAFMYAKEVARVGIAKDGFKVPDDPVVKISDRRELMESYSAAVFCRWTGRKIHITPKRFVRT